MPAYVEIYSADMRAALFRAVIDHGTDVRAALRAAAAGDLEHLAPDDQRTLAGMAYGYACELVRDERARRGNVQKVRADSTDAAHQLAARLLALADREVQRLETAKKREPVDTARGIAAAKMAREALALTRDAATEPKQPTSKQPTAPAPRPTTLAAAIAAGESTATHNAPGSTSDEATPATHTKTEHTHNQSHDAVRSRADSSLRDASVTAV